MVLQNAKKMGYVNLNKNLINLSFQKMYTEWMQLPSGTFTFVVKFCRSLKMIEPEKSDEILDSRGILTKSFRLLNI